MSWCKASFGEVLYRASSMAALPTVSARPNLFVDSDDSNFFLLEAKCLVLETDWLIGETVHELLEGMIIQIIGCRYTHHIRPPASNVFASDRRQALAKPSMSFKSSDFSAAVALGNRYCSLLKSSVAVSSS
jgi:hypothetical protein